MGAPFPAARMLSAFALNGVYLALALATIYALTILSFRLPRLRVRIESRRDVVLLVLLAIVLGAANWVYVWKTQSGG